MTLAEGVGSSTRSGATRARGWSSIVRVAVPVVTGFAMLGFHADPSRASARRCPTDPRYVIAADSGAKAYRVPGAGEYDYAVYACLNRGRRVYLDDTVDLGQYVGNVRVAGRYAAHVLAYGREYQERVVLTNLRTGATASLSSGGESYDLELTRAGTIVVAEVLRASPELRPTPADPVRVRYRTRLGVEVTLDTGAVMPGSLAVSRSGKRVYWISAGIPRSAPLP